MDSQTIERQTLVMFDLQRLDNAIAQIERHPETHTQSVWRCKTGMCLFGWVCELDPQTHWLNDLDADFADLCMVYINNDPSDWCGVPERAEYLLGITEDEGMELSAATNTLADIKRIRDELAAKYGALVPALEGATR